LSPVHGEGKGDTLGALMKMGKYLYDIFSNNPKVHPKLRFYIDDEIRDEKRRQNLNQGLLALLKAKQAKCYIFPANEIWKLYGTSITFSFLGNKKHKYLLDALEGEDFNLDSLIALEQRKRTFNEPLGRLIYTLPIEFDG